MLDKTFTCIYDIATGITLEAFLICVGVALVLGVAIAAVSGFRARCSGSFLMTLALLPAIVAVVIMMVNGNLGAGVAVAGAFSLVRFRSVPGTAKEIGAIFLAMAVGLACGMGYPVFAALFAGIMCLVILAFSAAVCFEWNVSSLSPKTFFRRLCSCLLMATASARSRA